MRGGGGAVGSGAVLIKMKHTVFTQRSLKSQMGKIMKQKFYSLSPFRLPDSDLVSGTSRLLKKFYVKSGESGRERGAVLLGFLLLLLFLDDVHPHDVLILPSLHVLQLELKNI